MSWWRRTFGLDGFDLAVHAAVTLIGLVWVVTVNHREDDQVIFSSMVAVTSLVILAVRRRLALNRIERSGAGRVEDERIAELEQRVAELELDRARVGELEERLDFAERLLASSSERPKELAP